MKALLMMLLGPCPHPEFYWYEKPDVPGTRAVYCCAGGVWHLR